MTVDELFKEFDAKKDELLGELFEFLKIPSVSSEREYEREVLRAASWIENFLKGMGLSVERWTGGCHPVVFAEYNVSPALPTLMFYQHYDVQPVDPLSEWESPPFEPTIRDGQIYCRGAQDNKGQCFYVLAALRTLLKREGSFPVNLKLIIEGNEETGSETLVEILPSKKDRIKCDGLVVTDVGVPSLDTPAITLGTRGMVSMTLNLTGSNVDLHSGIAGGMVYNPNRALAEMLASLYEPGGRVAIPGFYDDVVETTKSEMSAFDFSYDEKRFVNVFGTLPTGGEAQFPPIARTWIRPTVEINGLGGGYTGSGFKTVIPAHALAKISCRLVPNQDPRKIANLVREYILSKVPAGIKAEITIHSGFGKPLRTSPDSRVAKAAQAATSEVYSGKACAKILTGGSIPIISELAELSGSETVFLGYALDTDQIHAPNEHYGIDRLRLGFATTARLVKLFAER